MNLSPYKKNGTENGQAMAELGIMLVVIILVLFGGFELSNLVLRKTQAQDLSYQLAKNAHRHCRNAIDMDACFDESLTETQTVGDNVLSDLNGSGKMILTLYNPDFDNCDPTTVKQTSQRSKGSASGSSQFSASSISADIFKYSDALIVAEVYYDHKMLTPLSTFLGGLGFPAQVYGTSRFVYESAKKYKGCVKAPPF